jgi:anti-sigma regulatory factor (Ser/Thr protein kinase)
LKYRNDSALLLRIHEDMAFLPLATSFVEKAALAYGLAGPEAMALTLATEEIFAYLCRTASQGRPFEIRCASGGYYVKTSFSIPIQDLNLRAFNLTASVSPDDEASLDEMGLLIASRFVDRLQVRQEGNGGIQLTVVKEKSYPQTEAEPIPIVRPLDDYTIRTPAPEEIKLFVRLIHAYYDRRFIPTPFKYSGKVVDMVVGGEYQALIARGPTGQMGGGIFWHWLGAKTIECFGPYIFNQNTDSVLPRDLLEGCIGAIAKTHAVGLINRMATKIFSSEHFEPLGVLTVHDPDGSTRSITAHFREMHEDTGSSAWAHPDLVPFLKEQYGRLVLPREVLSVSGQGEAVSPYSVLSAEFERSQNRVTLRLLRPGKDMEENLINHLKIFEKEYIRNVLFEIDVAQPWQASLTPALLAQGFRPRLILPYGGDEGDMVVFQYGSVEP